MAELGAEVDEMLHHGDILQLIDCHAECPEEFSLKQVAPYKFVMPTRKGIMDCYSSNNLLLGAPLKRGVKWTECR